MTKDLLITTLNTFSEETKKEFSGRFEKLRAALKTKTTGKIMPRTCKKRGSEKSCVLSFRTFLGWTQEKLGKSIGATQRMVSCYESKRALPPPRVIQKILKLAQKKKYKLTYDDFVGDYDMY
jgi:ribosome-binding protein aMBF1 (putative translation factor)